MASILSLFLAIALISCVYAAPNVTTGINGLEKIVLRGSRSSAVEVYLYGGQVTSWKNKNGEELLFVSSKAIFKPPTAIRGGIPICFPQFSSFGPLQSHGFARNRIWSIDTNPPPCPTSIPAKSFVDLILKPTEADLKIWPNSFVYRLRVSLLASGALVMTSRVNNTNANGNPFTFTFAYHNYFRVSNISNVQVQGLKNLDYLDNLQNRTRLTEKANEITFQSELDRVYLGTPSKVVIQDLGKKRTFVVRKYGLPDTVVWNPWKKVVSDLGTEDHQFMVAVETAAVGTPITVKAGEEWTGIEHLSALH